MLRRLLLVLPLAAAVAVVLPGATGTGPGWLAGTEQVDLLAGVEPGPRILPARAHPLHEEALEALGRGDTAQVVERLREAYTVGLQRGEVDRILAEAMLHAGRAGPGIFHASRAFQDPTEVTPRRLRVLADLYRLAGNPRAAARTTRRARALARAD